jgi:hypothetical protein
VKSDKKVNLFFASSSAHTLFLHTHQFIMNPIALTPDMYIPSVNDDGEYVDRAPVIHHGMYCPCSTRRDKVYDTVSKFSSHVKTKSHQKWLAGLNQNRANYYSDMLKHKALVEAQKKIIGQLEQQLQNRTTTIDYLAGQLTAAKQSTEHVANLLELDD